MAKNFKNKGAYKKWLGYIYANDLNKPGGEDVTIGGKKHKVDRSTAKQINMNKTHAYQAKPDYIDIDGDGNKKESMKEAAASAKSPAKKYDRVVLGGNKGDKSKTHKGKDYSPAPQKGKSYKKKTSAEHPDVDKPIPGGNKGKKEDSPATQKVKPPKSKKRIKPNDAYKVTSTEHPDVKNSPAKMNRYDKDMMHERELIYDAKKEIHKEDVAKHKSMAKQGTSFAARFHAKSPVNKMHYGKSPAGKFEAFDQMDTYDAKKTAGMSPAMKQGCQLSKHMKSR